MQAQHEARLAERKEFFGQSMASSAQSCLSTAENDPLKVWR